MSLLLVENALPNAGAESTSDVTHSAASRMAREIQATCMSIPVEVTMRSHRCRFGAYGRSSAASTGMPPRAFVAMHETPHMDSNRKIADNRYRDAAFAHDCGSHERSRASAWRRSFR